MTDEPLFTLVVETPDGRFLRPIMPASILSSDLTVGDAAETAIRNAAAYWGLPDFVFGPSFLRRGSGTRELGDALLIVGERAASIQVKARGRLLGPEPRERLWLDKKIAEAARQSRGTVRSLVYGRKATLVNGRGRRMVVKVDTKKWVRVVVLEHPGVDGYTPNGDVLVFFRHDWEFLFDQLKSTYAVLEYLERISTLDPVPLGQESVRYYRLAAADRAAKPTPLDDRLEAAGAYAIRVPVLPQEPARYGEIIRIILEDLATAPWPTETDFATVNEVLATVDTAPVGYRNDLGATIQQWLVDVAADPSMLKWRFRRMVSRPGQPGGADRHQLIFAAAPRHDQGIQDGFDSYVSLRHEQMVQLIPERRDLTTVGILLTPRHDGGRPWDTTMAYVRDASPLDPAYRNALELLWGKTGEMAVEPDMAAVITAFDELEGGDAPSDE